MRRALEPRYPCAAVRVCVYTVKRSRALYTCKIYQACVCEHDSLSLLPPSLRHSRLCNWNQTGIRTDLKTFAVI